MQSNFSNGFIYSKHNSILKPLLHNLNADFTTSATTSVCHSWTNAARGNHATEDDATAAIESNEYAAAATATATATVRSYVKRAAWLMFYRYINTK